MQNDQIALNLLLNPVFTNFKTFQEQKVDLRLVRLFVAQKNLNQFVKIERTFVPFSIRLKNGRLESVQIVKDVWMVMSVLFLVFLDHRG